MIVKKYFGYFVLQQDTIHQNLPNLDLAICLSEGLLDCPDPALLTAFTRNWYSLPSFKPLIVAFVAKKAKLNRIKESSRSSYLISEIFYRSNDYDNHHVRQQKIFEIETMRYVNNEKPLGDRKVSFHC